jgi:hypothetical protein
LTLFDPLDFFRLGQHLVTNGTNESDYRTAIGRSYYACHLVARDRLFGIDGRQITAKVTKQIVGKKRVGSHEVIIKAVAQNSHLRRAHAKRLSDQLGQLKDMRVQADYYRDPLHKRTVSIFAAYNVKDWPGLANAAMTLASNLLPSLRQLRP